MPPSYYPLHDACFAGNISSVKGLIDNDVIKIDINLIDLYGKTAIYYAVCNNNVAIVCLLARKGANINSSTKHGISLLHEVCGGSKWYSMMLVLLKFKIQVSICTCFGWQALHFACRDGSLKQISLLVKKRADIFCLTNVGLFCFLFFVVSFFILFLCQANLSPLLIAVKSRGYTIVKYLIRLGANRPYDGTNIVVDYASTYRSQSFVCWLKSFISKSVYHS